MGVVHPQDPGYFLEMGRDGAREDALISLSLVHIQHPALHGNVTRGCLRSAGGLRSPHCPAPAPLGQTLQFIAQTAAAHIRLLEAWNREGEEGQGGSLCTSRHQDSHSTFVPVTLPSGQGALPAVLSV